MRRGSHNPQKIWQRNQHICWDGFSGKYFVIKVYSLQCISSVDQIYNSKHVLQIFSLNCKALYKYSVVYSFDIFLPPVKYVKVFWWRVTWLHSYCDCEHRTKLQRYLLIEYENYLYMSILHFLWNPEESVCIQGSISALK